MLLVYQERKSAAPFPPLPTCCNCRRLLGEKSWLRVFLVDVHDYILHQVTARESLRLPADLARERPLFLLPRFPADVALLPVRDSRVRGRRAFSVRLGPFQQTHVITRTLPHS